MSTFYRLLTILTRVDRWVLPLLLILFLLSGGILLRRFYVANTELVPTVGGTYIEGSVGELLPLIPWFTVRNDVNRDIVSLVFSGLLKYNPDTQSIEEDLATMEVSSDGRIYSLKLKMDIFWHDSTSESPHPVTADDILFTFQTIQNPGFPNTILRQNFEGVEIEKLDERTVRFRLEEPYNFFPSNLTIGLVPRRPFEGIPVEKLNQALDFGFHPIGAGPYAFKSLVQTELSTEVTLERFPRTMEPAFHLERVIFRIFPDYATLLSDLRNLGGVRLVPRGKDGNPLIPRRFHASNYTLPQYVALFFNLEKPFLQDQMLRLGLQLGTDKQKVVEAIAETAIVDTPLLEIDTSDWRYQFDPGAAQGALFESNWNLPEKIRLQRLLERKDANETGPVRLDPIVYLQTGAFLTLTGSFAGISTGCTINGLPIRASASTGVWIVALPTDGSSGTLALGENVVRMLSPAGDVIDSFYIWRTDDDGEFKRASEEQHLVDQFLRTRAGEASTDNAITVQSLVLDRGKLRRRGPMDATDVRINEQGEKLVLTLVTSPSPKEYAIAAETIKEQWEALGVGVKIEVPATREQFEERMLRRDYDVLLFGQSLLDNLDAYPYWHGSEKQRQAENKHELRIDAYNLSQYASLEADTLLEVIRQTRSDGERSEALRELREVLKQDVPAVFLYSPLYTFAHHQDVLGVQMGSLSLHSDRFLSLHRWYIKEQRVFRDGKGWLSFPGWLFSSSHD